LGAIKRVIDRRTARLEKKYARIARTTDELLRQPLLRGGNARQPDPAQVAVRQYQIGQLVQKRDHLEAKYVAWQGAAEKCRRTVGRVRDWKGRWLPYTLGALDAVGVAVLIDYFGAQSAGVAHLVDQVTALLAN